MNGAIKTVGPLPQIHVERIRPARRRIEIGTNDAVRFHSVGLVAADLHLTRVEIPLDLSMHLICRG